MPHLATLALASLTLGGLAAGCGPIAPAPAAPANTPAKATPPPIPSPVYAALFQKGAAWSYKVTTTVEGYLPDDPHADASGNVKTTETATAKCTVTEVRSWRRGVMSQIDCGDVMVPTGEVLAGTWVATADGLYHLAAAPAAGADPDLTDVQMTIAARPVAGKQERHDQGDEEGFGSSTEIVREGDSWCSTLASWGGDEGYATLCFGPGGVVRGGGGWAGGSTHDTTFDLLR